jgi:hypothetical protein
MADGYSEGTILKPPRDAKPGGTPTRTLQTATPLFVKVQNRVFLGPGARHITGSGGVFGRAGKVES